MTSATTNGTTSLFLLYVTYPDQNTTISPDTLRVILSKSFEMNPMSKRLGMKLSVDSQLLHTEDNKLDLSLILGLTIGGLVLVIFIILSITM